MPAKWVQVPGKTTKKRPLKTLLKIQKKHIDMFDVIFQETLWIVAMCKKAKYASAGVIWVPLVYLAGSTLRICVTVNPFNTKYKH